MEKITSAVIGELRQDDRFHNWWISEETTIPFFDGKTLTINFIDCEPEKDAKFIDEADGALKNFLALTSADRLKISHHVYRNCAEHLEIAEFDGSDQLLRDINSENEIWRLVHPRWLYVSRRR